MAVTLPTVVRGGTAVLLLVPEFDAADAACLRLLVGDESPADRLVAVTVDGSGEAFVDAWVDRAGTDRTALRVVDVSTGMRSVTAGQATPSAAQNVIQSIEDERDLDSIRACVESLVGEPAGSGDPRTIYLDSLDALLEEAGSRATFDLVDDLSALARLADGIAFVRVDPSDRTRHTIRTLASLFDVTLRLEPDGRDATWTVQPARSTLDDHVDATPPDLDELFRLLSVRHRRLALHRLLETDGPVSATDLAAWIADIDASDADLAVQRIYTGLVHVHLPMLEEHDVISMDDDGDTVRLRPTADRLGQLLALSAKGDLLG